MAEEVSLADVPEGFKNRFSDVLLLDGSTVKVWKWSNQKYPAMIPLIANLDAVPMMAEQAVAPADRDRVRAMDWQDLIAIKVASVNLNLSEAAIKNLAAHLAQMVRVTDAIQNNPSQSKVS